MAVASQNLLRMSTLTSWKIVVVAARRSPPLLRVVVVPVLTAAVALAESVVLPNQAVLMVPLVKGLMVVVVMEQFVENVLNAVDLVDNGTPFKN